MPNEVRTSANPASVAGSAGRVSGGHHVALDRTLAIEVPGATLWVGTIGSGHPILIMHGGCGLDHSYLRSGLDALSDRHMVVYYDLRDNGRSRVTGPRTPFSFAQHVADADAVRRAIGVPRMAVFGHSYGGRIAQEYALAHPDRVSALVLCATDAHFDYAHVAVGNAERRGTAAEVAAVRRLLSGPVDSDEEWGRLFTTILPLYYHDRSVARTDPSMRDIVYRASSFNASTFEGLAQFDTRARLNSIRTPTLVLSGADDWITPLDQASRVVADGVPGARLVVFENSGHMPFIEERRRFVEVVGSWLEAVR